MKRTKKPPKLTKKPIVITHDNLPRLLNAHPKQVFHAFKLIAETHGPVYYNCALSAIRYYAGTTHSEPRANTDNRKQCGAGLNVASLEWCLYGYVAEVAMLKPTDLLATVEFTGADIAALPGIDWDGTRKDVRGKFRLRRLKVLAVRTLAVAEVEQANRYYGDNGTPRSLVLKQHRIARRYLAHKV